MATDIDPGATSEASLALGPLMSDRRLGERLESHIAEAEVDLLCHAHIVVCTDDLTGTSTYTGPFEDAMSALSAAAELEDAHGPGCGDGSPPVRCVIAPLFSG